MPDLSIHYAFHSLPLFTAERKQIIMEGNVHPWHFAGCHCKVQKGQEDMGLQPVGSPCRMSLERMACCGRDLMWRMGREWPWRSSRDEQQWADQSPHSPVQLGGGELGEDGRGRYFNCLSLLPVTVISKWPFGLYLNSDFFSCFLPHSYRDKEGERSMVELSH